jgi:hypothetical protein
VTNDSHQNLVEVRRSSGEKEWMTREKLEALNKQRALKRGKSEKSIKQSTSKKTKWTAISIWLNALLLIALLMILLYLTIDSGF